MWRQDAARVCPRHAIVAGRSGHLTSPPTSASPTVLAHYSASRPSGPKSVEPATDSAGGGWAAPVRGSATTDSREPPGVTRSYHAITSPPQSHHGQVTRGGKGSAQ